MDLETKAANSSSMRKQNRRIPGATTCIYESLNQSRPIQIREVSTGLQI